MPVPNSHSQMLAYAAETASNKGQRWTETRQQVYETLLQSLQPVTAYQLLENVAVRHKRSVNAPSIYRALDALCQLGLAIRVESLNAFLACNHPQDDHEHVLLVCDNCHQADEIEGHGINSQLIKGAQARGFKTKRQVLELHGACGACHH